MFTAINLFGGLTARKKKPERGAFRLFNGSLLSVQEKVTNPDDRMQPSV